MIFYAIRDKRNGGYLPNGPGRGGRGFTSKEAISPKTLKVAPRLYDTHDTARRSLIAWLQGEWRSIWLPVDEETIEIIPRNRKAENMEIVEIEIK